MNIYTSFYSCKTTTKHNAVAISVSPPTSYRGRRYTKLAPLMSNVLLLKSGQLTEKQYTDEYFQLLEDRKLNPFQVVEELGDGAIMVCYELPSLFCHRHLAGQWITTHTGIIVKERSLLKGKNVDTLFTF